MASVRMTGILRDEIISNAMNAFDKANPEIEYKPKHVNEIIDFFTSSKLQTFWKETHAKASKLNAEVGEPVGAENNVVVSEITRFKCNLQSPAGHADKWVSFNVKDCPKFYGYHPSKDLGRDSYYSTLQIYLVERDDLYKKVYADYKNALDKINHRNETRRKYINGIRELTNKCTTVHRMLDVEPSMETFVPPEKIQAMHIKMTRAKVAEHIEENIEFDSSLTKQVALTSKLMGA